MQDFATDHLSQRAYVGSPSAEGQTELHVQENGLTLDQIASEFLASRAKTAQFTDRIAALRNSAKYADVLIREILEHVRQSDISVTPWLDSILVDSYGSWACHMLQREVDASQVRSGRELNHKELLDSKGMVLTKLFDRLDEDLQGITFSALGGRRNIHEVIENRTKEMLMLAVVEHSKCDGGLVRNDRPNGHRDMGSAGGKPQPESNPNSPFAQPAVSGFAIVNGEADPHFGGKGWSVDFELGIFSRREAAHCLSQIATDPGGRLSFLRDATRKIFDFWAVRRMKLVNDGSTVSAFVRELQTFCWPNIDPIAAMLATDEERASIDAELGSRILLWESQALEQIANKNASYSRHISLAIGSQAGPSSERRERPESEAEQKLPEGAEQLAKRFAAYANEVGAREWAAFEDGSCSGYLRCFLPNVVELADGYIGQSSLRNSELFESAVLRIRNHIKTLCAPSKTPITYPWRVDEIFGNADFRTRLRSLIEAELSPRVQADTEQENFEVSQWSDQQGVDNKVAAGRQGTIERFIRSCSTRRKRISRVDIWRAAGYKDPTMFERYQRAAANCSDKATKKFDRLLAMTPADFLVALTQKKSGK